MRLQLPAISVALQLIAVVVATAPSSAKTPTSEVQSSSSQVKPAPTTNQRKAAIPSSNKVTRNKKVAHNRRSESSDESKMTTTTTMMPLSDPIALAQREIRAMLGYNNTPPLFITKTRDLYVDVARFPLGTKVATVQAHDDEGDPIEFALEPANTRDASPNFSIDPRSGELRLINKDFVSPFRQKLDTNSDSQVTNLGDAVDEQEAAEGEENSEADAASIEEQSAPNRLNLNVVAFDGSYTSVLELKIHVVNSSSPRDTIKSIGGGLPIQLPGGSPAKIKVDPIERVSPATESTTAAPQLLPPIFLSTPPSASEPITPDKQHVDRSGHVQAEPMVVSLVIACSCMMIALVLLMFIVPISVKRLRKRLKHVERQHEQLSQQNSNGSTTLGSSASDMTDHRHNHKHDVCSSLSQFTLTSDRSHCTLNRAGGSGICRQSSLDLSSMATVMSHPGAQPMPMSSGTRLDNFDFSRANQMQQPFNRVNNGSIANPMYLQQVHHQVHSGLVSQQQVSIQPQQAQPFFVRDRMAAQTYNQQQQLAPDIYYPIDDDEFYSTINTESSIIDTDHGSNVNEGLPPAKLDPFLVANEASGRAEADSPSSSPSIRALTRFLSLPARHAAHQAHENDCNGQNAEAHTTLLNDTGHNNQPFKTIARTLQVDREQKRQGQWELDRNKLRLLHILDEGQFGLVWRAMLTPTDRRQHEQVVAVKSLKKGNTKDERGRDELLAEIEIMKLVCDHPNVVKILHCCTRNTVDSPPSAHLDGSQILLIMEYVELGKLQSYLKKSRSSHNYATSSMSGSNIYHGNGSIQTTTEQVTSKDLIKFIYHIAKGMEYVSANCIVHRDLASRNILVSSQKICKIGDFGMARHMQSIGGVYERHSRNTKIPVRWMAPEVLLENRFTTKSDVFSFGILVWEIVTLGSTPYAHLETEQVIEEVAWNGERPERPNYCHSELYKIMSRCWSSKPEERPTFSWLVRQLDELLLSANNYIELDQYPDHDYYNMDITAAPNELL